MADSLQGDLSVSLATRLNLQISLSSLPVVEEWMDPKMDRWLEAVPMPPELPQGERAQFLVGVASDFSRVRWAAFGHPAGFVPKMADYLSKCAVKQTEVDIINTIGERFEPARVGTWIAVRAREIYTGWQFVDALPLADMASISADIPALQQLAVWAGAGGIENCSRISRCLGDTAHIEIDIALPSAAIATRAFAELANVDLPEQLVSAAPVEELTLVFRADPSGIGRLSVVWPESDRVACMELAASVGAPCDDGMERLQGALGAPDVALVELSSDGAEARVDLHFVPGRSAPKARPN